MFWVNIMAHQHSSSSFTYFQLKILETMLCKSCFLFFFMFAFLSVLFCFFEWNGYCAKSWNMIIIAAYTTAAVGWRETGWWKYDISMGVAFDIALEVWYCQGSLDIAKPLYRYGSTFDIAMQEEKKNWRRSWFSWILEFGDKILKIAFFCC